MPGAAGAAEQHTNLDLDTCKEYCKANPACHYVNWVEPAGNGQCSLWAQCGEMCQTDHCWAWWTTYEFLDRPGLPAWNTTPCDSLPEKPSEVDG